LEKANEKYKRNADLKRRSVEFNEGDFVYAVLTKDRFPVGTYNKLKARKIGPVEILKKINDNAYQLKLPNDIYTSDVFNVKHIIPYYEEEQSGKEDRLNSRTNSSQPGEDDAVRYKEGEEHSYLIPHFGNDLSPISHKSSNIQRPRLTRHLLNSFVSERSNPLHLNDLGLPSLTRLKTNDLSLSPNPYKANNLNSIPQ